MKQKLFYLCLIRVGNFCVNSIIAFDVLKSVVHQTTMTTIVTKCWWTINQILFTERDKFSSLPKVLSFQSSSLRKERKKRWLDLPIFASFFSKDYFYEEELLTEKYCNSRQKEPADRRLISTSLYLLTILYNNYPQWKSKANLQVKFLLAEIVGIEIMS